MHGGPGPRGGMLGGPRPGMGPRPGGFGGMHHSHRPTPPPPMDGGYPHHPHRGGCCGCAIPTLALSLAAIAGMIAILF